MTMRRLGGGLFGAVVALALAGCSGDYSAPESYQRPEPKVGQNAGIDPDDTVFGADGLVDALFGEDEEGDGGRLPVNRYLWQGSLETLSFLPLASADPFTGVIATEWSTTPDSPAERFKVAAYVTSHELEASSLRVAVFREDRREDGIWVPTPVSAETVRRLEDAILTRSRQIRVAEIESEQAS